MKTMPSIRRRAGFTLIEMIITLCVFALLAGAVFGIFGATLQGVSSLQDDQQRENRADALGAWLKQSFLELPADGIVVSRHRDGVALQVADVIWGNGSELRALDLNLQPNGHYTLRLATWSHPASSPPVEAAAAARAFATQVTADDPALEWRPLIHDLKTADWRFRQPNVTRWQDTSPESRQVLFVELSFQSAGSHSVITDDFWVPPLQPAATPALPSAATVTANP